MRVTLIVLFIAQLWVGCSGLGFILCADYHFYLEEKSNRLTSVEFGLGGIVGCKDFGTVSTLQAVYIRLPHHCATVVDANGMNSVMKLCPKVEKDRLISSLFLDKLPKFRYNIFPGTRWCGAGNISDSEETVGTFAQLDSCCRTHDKCPFNIAVGETVHGITNDLVGTISACECDDTFYKCLQNIKHVESDNVGFTFFNVLSMPCFKSDFPIVKCLEKGGLFNKQCEKYELDTTKEPIYQLFDSKVYYPLSLKDKLGDLFA